MSVTRDEVLRIARLAELHVEEDALPGLTEQLSRILEYVAQLAQAPAGEHAAPFLAGPDAIPLRPDEVRPWPLGAKPGQFAPAFREGFFTVPRLGQFEGVEVESESEA